MSKTAKAQRETFLALLRTHPDLTLEQLGLFPRDLLGAVRVGDLRPAEDAVDRVRLARARTAIGPEFDAIVLETLREAGHAVGAVYLRERLGGPRWKLQGSLARLADAGLVARKGATSNTRYRAIELEHIALAAE